VHGVVVAAPTARPAEYAQIEHTPTLGAEGGGVFAWTARLYDVLALRPQTSAVDAKAQRRIRTVREVCCGILAETLLPEGNARQAMCVRNQRKPVFPEKTGFWSPNVPQFTSVASPASLPERPKIHCQTVSEFLDVDGNVLYPGARIGWTTPARTQGERR